jgi:hypothetical protein
MNDLFHTRRGAAVSSAKVAGYYLIMLSGPLLMFLALACWYGLDVARKYTTGISVSYVGDNEIVFDSELGFRRPRNAVTRRVQPGIDYNIYTDNLAARVNRPGAQTADRVTILTVGDSFSEGYGLENELTYTERLGEMLGVPVANFALGSYSALQALISLKKNISLSPNVIVFGMIEDDLRRSLDPCAPNFFPFCLEVPTVGGIGRDPYIIPPDGTGVSGTQISIDLTDERITRGWGSRIILGLRLTFYALLKSVKTRSRVGLTGEPTEDAKAEAGLFVIREMIKIARELNATLIFLYISRLDGVKNDWILPHAFLSGLPEEVIFIDTTPAVKDFYSRNPGHKLTLPEDGHPNAQAHELFAEILKPKIMAIRSSK